MGHPKYFEKATNFCNQYIYIITYIYLLLKMIELDTALSYRDLWMKSWKW